MRAATTARAHGQLYQDRMVSNSQPHLDALIPAASSSRPVHSTTNRQQAVKRLWILAHRLHTRLQAASVRRSTRSLPNEPLSWKMSCPGSAKDHTTLKGHQSRLAGSLPWVILALCLMSCNRSTLTNWRHIHALMNGGHRHFRSADVSRPLNSHSYHDYSTPGHHNSGRCCTTSS